MADATMIFQVTITLTSLVHDPASDPASDLDRIAQNVSDALDVALYEVDAPYDMDWNITRIPEEPHA